MNPLLEQFLQEARENLAFIDQNIENIIDGDTELLNSVFRAAHTLKGGSGIVGFESVKEITHHAEDLLDQVRAGKLEFTSAMEDGLFDAFDEVVNLIEAAEESEDIVSADEDRVAQIVTNLNSLMGKTIEEDVWESPIMLLPDDINIVNDDLNFFKQFKGDIPFITSEITQENFDDKRLYGIYFDIDENCMLYGNDPLYALSLLKDSLKAVTTCLNDTMAKEILDSDKEDDLLKMKMSVIAFAYASYSEIEEALFNFMDDLLLKPLDIVSLLNVTRGEIATLDVIKDFAKHAAEKFISPDIESLKSSITETQGLIGKDTLQYRRLNRLNNLLPFIKEENYMDMIGFFEVLNSTNLFTVDTSVPVATPIVEETVTVEKLESTEEKVEAVSSAKTDMTDTDKSVFTSMLNQQLSQLRKNNNEATKLRVEAFIKAPLAAFGHEFSSHSSVESLIETIESIVNPDAVVKTIAKEENVVEEKVETVVETPVVEKEKEVTADVVTSTTVVPKKELIKKTSSAEQKKNVIGKTVKIEQESIDHLMNIVGELLVAKNSLPYLADNVGDMNTDGIKRSILEKYTSINRLSVQLQDIIMGMRMLPISYVFDRYPKLVRDISKTLGKKVNLTMDGGDTKLDKNIIEMLADPMIHIMRNSLDHGIELPEDRKKNGKSELGNVDLRAYAQSDKIIVEILDDGAGIDVERVIHKVIEKGLMTVEQIDKLTDNEKAELILLAGLSTAETITEFSGRGVGMDVVKKSIEGFGGTINISTTMGKGTTMTLSIPVSLAVTALLHVSLGGVHYGFPMESVKETVKMEQEEVAILHNEPFIYLRGEVIPLLYIKQMLDMDAVNEGILSIVVLNIKGNLLAVVVNELLGQLEVVQKPLEGLVENHPIFSGTALLGNGQIIMVIDQDGLLGMSHQLKEDEVKVS